MDYKNLTAICGIDCFNCPLFRDNINEAIRASMAHIMPNAQPDWACQGCRDGGCPLLGAGCQTKECAEKRGHWFCSECEEFPCAKFRPCADRAAQLPHNYKVYNLTAIKNRGLEAWAAEAAEVRRCYYQGKMHIGAGPICDDQ